MHESALQITEAYGSTSEPAYEPHLRLVLDGEPSSDQDKDPADNPEKDKNWDFDLTDYVENNAHEPVICPWLPGGEGTLGDAALAYYMPITKENVGFVKGELEMLERIPENEELKEPQEEIVPEEKIQPKETEPRKKSETHQPLLQKAEPIERPPKAEINESEIVRQPEARDKIQQEPITNVVPIRQTVRPPSSATKPTQGETPVAATRAVAGNAVATQTPEKATAQHPAGVKAEIVIPVPTKPPEQLSEVDAPLRFGVTEPEDTLSVVNPGEQPIDLMSIELAAAEDENLGLAQDRADTAPRLEIVEASLVDEIVNASIEGSAELVEDGSVIELLEDEPIIIREFDPPTDEAGEPTIVASESDEVFADPSLPLTELPIKIAAAIEAIIERPQATKANSPLEAPEAEVTEKPELVLVDFLERIPPQQEPQIIERLITYINENYSEQQITELKKQLASAVSQDGTRESIKRFLGCINTIQKAIHHAGVIGKSAIILYNSSVARAKLALSFNFS